ncbi:MAG: T9SS type A sorting domain-containing protein [Bacteroidetes bacterium]|nr:T9SS type A sorting domain-containing protein [Bacteroidota bacterium]
MQSGSLKITVFFIVCVFTLKAQVSMYRCYPQATQTLWCSYGRVGIQDPQKTLDGGYVFSYLASSYSPMGVEATSVSVSDAYTIKTDSNFVPQWKKSGYSKAIVLPTGGIILVYDNGSSMQGAATSQIGNTVIEKVTQSGVSVWVKQYTTTDIALYDGVCYDNKVRFVGSLWISTGWGNAAPAQAYTMLMDTMGNFISQSLFNNNYYVDWWTSYSNFSKIKRNAQGEFFVYNNDHSYNGAFNIAKFDSNFNLVWAKWNWGVRISDIDFLPSGGIFASANNLSFLKFDTQGNITGQSRLNIANRMYSAMSGLCKKNTGNYVLTEAWATDVAPPVWGPPDTLYAFEVDTSMNVVWSKNWFGGSNNYSSNNFGCNNYLAKGTSLIKNNQLYTPVHNFSQPFIMSSDTNGNNCASQTKFLTTSATSLSLYSFSLIPVASTASIVTANTTSLLSQNYADSCICAASVTVSAANVCVGNSVLLSSSGLGNLSWHAAPSGTAFIAIGANYAFSSNTPSVYTLYAQDNVCAVPNRVPVNIKVNAVPVLTLSSANYSICNGQTTIISVQGASSYTWSNALTTSSIVVTPTTSATYSVIGSVAPNCADTASINISVFAPTVNISTGSSSLVCSGTEVTVSATGATSYSWNTGETANSFTLLAQFSSSNAITQHTYDVVGINPCGTFSQTTVLNIAPNPSINVGVSNSVICQGNSVTLLANGATTYTWNNGISSGTISGNTNLFPTSSGSYNIAGSNSYACVSDTSTVYIEVKPSPTLSFNIPVVCAGKTTTITASGADSYLWNTSNTTSQLVVPSAQSGQTFAVTGYSINGCHSTNIASIAVNPLPVLHISSSSSSICAGSQVTLTTSGANSYTWNTGAQAPSIVVSPTSAVQYYVSTTSQNGCIGNSYSSMSVAPLPVLNVSSNYTICSPQILTLTVSGAYNYYWQWGTNAYATSTAIIVKPNTTTQYSVSGTDEFGCKSAKIVSVTISCVGVEELNAETDNYPSLQLRVYPNPANSMLNVECEMLNGEMDFQIITVLGEVIKHSIVTTKHSQIDVSGLENGIYFIKVGNASRKFVKE